MHSSIHNAVNDAVEAIQHELGLDPSGADATVAATLAALPSRYAPLTGGVILTTPSGTIPNNTVTGISWITEVSDPDGWHAPGSANVVVPAGKTGRYIICATGGWANGGTAVYSLTLTVNGATVAGNYATVAGYLCLTVVRSLVAGDTLGIAAFQSSGSAQGIDLRLEIAPS